MIPLINCLILSYEQEPNPDLARHRYSGVCRVADAHPGRDLCPNRCDQTADSRTNLFS